MAKAASFRVSIVLGGSLQLGQRRFRNDRSSLERTWLRVSSVRIPTGLLVSEVKRVRSKHQIPNLQSVSQRNVPRRCQES
jgi:hypothetical protein